MFKGSPNKRIVVLAVWDDNSCTAHLCLNNEEDVKSALDSVSNPIHAKLAMLPIFSMEII